MSRLEPLAFLVRICLVFQMGLTPSKKDSGTQMLKNWNWYYRGNIKNKIFQQKTRQEGFKMHTQFSDAVTFTQMAVLTASRTCSAGKANNRRNYSLTSAQKTESYITAILHVFLKKKRPWSRDAVIRTHFVAFCEDVLEWRHADKVIYKHHESYNKSNTLSLTIYMKTGCSLQTKTFRGETYCIIL